MWRSQFILTAVIALAAEVQACFAILLWRIEKQRDRVNILVAFFPDPASFGRPRRTADRQLVGYRRVDRRGGCPLCDHQGREDGSSISSGSHFHPLRTVAPAYSDIPIEIHAAILEGLPNRTIGNYEIRVEATVTYLDGKNIRSETRKGWFTLFGGRMSWHVEQPCF
jgi:hypothetical protein